MDPDYTGYLVTINGGIDLKGLIWNNDGIMARFEIEVTHASAIAGTVGVATLIAGILSTAF